MLYLKTSTRFLEKAIQQNNSSLSRLPKTQKIPSGLVIMTTLHVQHSLMRHDFVDHNCV